MLLVLLLQSARDRVPGKSESKITAVRSAAPPASFSSQAPPTPFGGLGISKAHLASSATSIFIPIPCTQPLLIAPLFIPCATHPISNFQSDARELRDVPVPILII
jgi:hypothetical protein